MQEQIGKLLWRVIRVVSLTCLAVVGTMALVRFAPGYFADSREMDAQHGSVARAEILQRSSEESSFRTSLVRLVRGWLKGDLGESRQYGVPVSQLVEERAGLTAKLLIKGIALGWGLSFSAALILSGRKRRQGETVISLTSAALMCVPAALLATVCLVLNSGGPVLVLAYLVAIRDFKILYRIFTNGVGAPAVLFARAQGYSFTHAVRTHVLGTLQAEFAALLMASLVVALSAVVPVEVIFDRAGLGQLAWSSAMNRDLPTLLAITLLMAALIGISSILADSEASQGLSACA